jgi:hypothetical protein
MPADGVVVAETPRARARNFTDSTLLWFEAGDAIGETPQSDVYADDPGRIRSIVVQAIALAVCCGAGVFGVWLAL